MAPARGEPLTRTALTAALPGLLLTLVFVYFGFPYQQLGETLVAEIGRGGRVHASFQTIEPRLQLAGPGVEVHGVRLGWDEEPALPFERVLLRPAWSLSWFALRPAFRADLDSAFGSAQVTFTLGSRRRVKARLIEVDAARLPIASLWPGLNLRGSVDARLDVRPGEQSPQGSVQIEARDGTVTVAALRVPLAYDTLEAQIELGNEALATLESLQLQDEALSVRGSGTIGTADRFADAPLRLEFDIEAQPAVAGILRGVGLRVSREGKVRARIAGTPARPEVR